MITTNEREFFTVLEEVLQKSEKAVYSIKIEKETDGTYDIRIWDERLEESCEDIEEGKFVDFKTADQRLNEIVRENNDILFLNVKKDM